MQVVYDIGVDLILAACRGLLFASCFGGLTNRRGIFQNRRKSAGALLTVQYVAIRMLFWWLPFFQAFFYGKDGAMLDMRQSIPMNLLYFFVSFLCVCLAYRERLQLLVYLTVTFYALEEMIRFMIYSISDKFSVLIWDMLGNMVELEQISLARFEHMVTVYNAAWTWIVNLPHLLALFCLCRRLCRELYRQKAMPDRQELNYLMMPGIISIGFGILLRGTVYKIKGSNVYHLLDANPELRLVIPVVAFLCIASMLQAASVLRRLKEAYDEKAVLQIYRQRAEDMEEHIQEMERLYDGIRSVKHDIKNYTADLEQLMRSCDSSSRETREEMQEYLDGLYQSMEQLDMRYSTGNAVTDVVVNRHFREARAAGIETECDFIFPRDMGIQAFDLAVILNNALENAREACEKEQEQKKYIRLEGECKSHFLILKIKNSFTGAVLMPDGDTDRKKGMTMLPVSSKECRSSHGIGMKNIEKCVEKYRGMLQWEIRDGAFVLVLMLQGR